MSKLKIELAHGAMPAGVDLSGSDSDLNLKNSKNKLVSATGSYSAPSIHTARSTCRRYRLLQAPSIDRRHAHAHAHAH